MKNNILRLLVISLALLSLNVLAQTQVPYSRFNVLAYDVPSEETGRTYRIEISLPLSYGSDDREYPVVYLTDGLFNFPMISSHVLTMSFDQLIEEPIVIGISYADDGLQNSLLWRLFDLTPSEVFDPELGQNVGGDADKFLDFISQTLKPLVKQNLKVDENNETFIGHSLGGLFSLYTLFTRPDTFENYIVMSPSIWWDDEIIFEYEKAYHQSNNDMNKDIFMSVGRHEDFMVKDMRRMYRKLNKRDYPSLRIDKKVFKGETHSSVIIHSASKGIRYVLDSGIYPSSPNGSRESK